MAGWLHGKQPQQWVVSGRQACRQRRLQARVMQARMRPHSATRHERSPASALMGPDAWSSSSSSSPNRGIGSLTTKQLGAACTQETLPAHALLLLRGQPCLCGSERAAGGQCDALAEHPTSARGCAAGRTVRASCWRQQLSPAGVHRAEQQLRAALCRLFVRIAFGAVMGGLPAGPAAPGRRCAHLGMYSRRCVACKRLLPPLPTPSDNEHAVGVECGRRGARG